MESMALVPQAARTMVHKYCIFSWAKLQFELSKQEPNRASAEERERYVRLVELCVRGCVDGEERKLAAASAVAASTSTPASGLTTSGNAAITITTPTPAKIGAHVSFSDSEPDSDSDSDDSDSDANSSDGDSAERTMDPLARPDEEDNDPLMTAGKVATEDTEIASGSGKDDDEGSRMMVLLASVIKPRPDWLVDIESFIDTAVEDAGKCQSFKQMP